VRVSTSRQLSWQRRLVARVQTRLWLAATLVLLLVAIYVVLGRQAMSLVPEFRSQLETTLEERLQTPLEIGTLRGEMDGMSPVFVLEDVRLPAPEGEAPLTIQHIALTVDVLPTLVQRDLRLRQLLVRGLDLHLSRNEQGQMRLKGLGALGGGETASGPPRRLLDIIYRQNRLVLDETNLTLEWHGFPALKARDVEMALVNSGERHQLAARVVTDGGARSLDLRLALQGDAYRAGDVAGELYARLSGEGWQKWLAPKWSWPVEPEQVDGELALWSEIRAGELHSATLRVAADRMTLRDQRDDSRWPIKSAFALARLDARDGGYLLSLADLTVATPEGEWRAGEMGLLWNGRRDDDLRWKFLARDFNLRTSRNQFVAVPFELPENMASWRRQLDELAPGGRVRSLYASGSRDAVLAYSGRVDNLHSDARDKVPGVGGLSGWFAGAGGEGVAQLETEQLRLDLPRMYAQPLQFAARGGFRWWRDDQALFVQSGRIQAGNQDASGNALMGLRLEPEQTPELRLIAEVLEGKGQAVATYIPGNKLKDGLGHWLKNAFEAGRVPRGRFLYQGPVKIDPARQQDRTFQMLFHARNLQLHYLEGWPDITGLSGRVLIDGRKVAGRGLSGRLLGTRLQKMTFDVSPQPQGKPARLVVSGKLEGPASDLTTLFHDTPLRDALPDELAHWQLSAGRLEGALLMNWPLGPQAGSEQLRVTGRLTSATLGSEKREISVTDLTGDVAYDLQQGLEIPELTGELFGRQVAGSVTSVGNRSRINLEGDAALDDVRQWLGMPAFRPVSGEFDYQAALTLPWHGDPLSIRVSSSLASLGIDVPAPFGKPVGRERASSFTWRATQPEATLAFRYGDLAHGNLMLADQGLKRGHVVLGGAEAGAANEPGLLITGNLPALNVATWVDWLAAQPGAGGDNTLLRKLWLNIAELDLYGVGVSDATFSVVPERDGWSMSLDSPTLAGDLWLPPQYRADGERPMALTVSKADITLPEGEGGDLSPTDFPIVDANIQKLSLNGTDYGQWQALVRPRTNGVVFQSLQGQWRRTNFNGELEWFGPAGARRSHYVGSVSSDRLDRTLKAWDMEPMIESRDARAVLDVEWPGGPADLVYTALQGRASVEIGEARIPETNRSASALRVLGVFNISSISRRLRLDFSDLYKKGLTCDSISGDFNIEGPVVSTENLVIKSPSAEFRVKGQSDIEQETLGLEVEVSLPLSSNLYAGCLAGPAACAGIFVFERIWGNRLEKMTTLGYRVTGTWDDPKVKETQGLLERSKE
jgi:uncharacterized protein (TIGR02099 family)